MGRGKERGGRKDTKKNSLALSLALMYRSSCGGKYPLRKGKQVNVYEYEKAQKIAERLDTTPAKILNDFEDFVNEFSIPEWNGDYCEEGCATPENACLLCVEGNDYLGYWG